MLVLNSTILFHLNSSILKRKETWLIFLKTVATLARNLFCEVCANLVDFIKKIIFSWEFLQQSRHNPADFSRNRSLPFTSLILFFCNFLKSSYQPELNKFFKILSGSTVAQKMVLLDRAILLSGYSSLSSPRVLISAPEFPSKNGGSSVHSWNPANVNNWSPSMCRSPLLKPARITAWIPSQYKYAWCELNWNQGKRKCSSPH